MGGPGARARYTRRFGNGSRAASRGGGLPVPLGPARRSDGPLSGQALRRTGRRAAGGRRTGEGLPLTLGITVHQLGRELRSLLELRLEPLVALEHSRNVVSGLGGELAHPGSKVAGVQGPAVVLGQHHLRIAVGGEEDVQIEGRRVGVLLGVVESGIVVVPAEGPQQKASGGRPDLVEAAGVRMASGLRVIAAL